MKIILTGTSNSIITKGLSFGLRDSKAVSELSNLSFGASGSVAMGSHLRRMDFTGVDFCLLDYCVNEEVFIEQGQSSAEIAMNTTMAMLDAAARAGCQPVVLILPSTLRKVHPRLYEAALEDALAPLGVPIFNVYRLFDLMPDRPFRDWFMDSMHITREVVYHLGTVLADWMAKTAAGRPRQPLVTERRYHPVEAITTERCALTGRSLLRHYENKMMKISLQRLEGPGQIELPIDRPAKIIGLTYNAGRTIGSLTISGEDTPFETIKATVLFSTERGFTVISTPVRTPPRVDPPLARIDYTPIPSEDGRPEAALELIDILLEYIDDELPMHVLSHQQLETQQTQTDLDAFRATLGHPTPLQSDADVPDPISDAFLLPETIRDPIKLKPTLNRVLPDITCQLGESPIWDDRVACFYWVDIKGGDLHQFNPITKAHGMAKNPETVSCLGLKASGGLVMAGRSGIWAIDDLDGTPEHIISWPALPDDTRTNDGKIGPDGAFWISTMQDRDDRGPSGVVMRVTPDGTITTPLEGFTTPNGIAWSPNGTKMYLCDTRELWVDVWDFDPKTGELGARTRFVTLDSEQGKPDGAVVDIEGNYWVAAPYGHAVHGFSSSGNHIETIAVPTLMPTMPCLGGTDFKQMLVTSLIKQDTPDDGSGGVFTTQLTTAGMQSYRFDV